MDFYSINFVLFTVISLFFYFTAYKFFPTRQWVILLFSSITFYAICDLKSFVFILITAIITWGGALISQRIGKEFRLVKNNKAIDRAYKKSIKEKILFRRRIILFAVLLINFGILAYMKYWTVMWNGFVAFANLDPGLNWGNILLPLGISFYTFQSTGYMIDVHNDKYDAEPNFGKFLLFISFFPQLIQGPINRFDALAAQLIGAKAFVLENLRYGILLVLFGFLKKYAIADLLDPAVAAVLDKGGNNLPGSVILFGVFLYAIQQYADFSGGIDIVLGVARMFGIKMTPNFRQPYFSTSLGEFWRRWHITLGAWMRDYVFYPFVLTKTMLNFGKWTGIHLGKHMGKVLPVSVGNLLVFFLVGIWHGPQMHFVLWGLYNGVVIALTDLLAPVTSKIRESFHINAKSKYYHIFLILLTFTIVTFGGYFDRIEDVRKAWHYLWLTFFSFHGGTFSHMYTNMIHPVLKQSAVNIVLASSLLVFINSVLQEKGTDTFSEIGNRSTGFQWGVYFTVILLILFSFMIVKPGTGGFMYANF